MNYHAEALSSVQSRVLQRLGPVFDPRDFYLVGGTAIAIQLGHRRSVDLDWFTERPMRDPLVLAGEIRNEGIALVTTDVERGTLHGRVSGVRISVLEYPYPSLEPTVYWPPYQCQLASLADLACMKLSAIVNRGAKKDFIDLFALARTRFSLAEMLALYQRKYSVSDIAHLLYALAYFEQADCERTPKMLWDVNWQAIKRSIRGWVRDLAG